MIWNWWCHNMDKSKKKKSKSCLLPAAVVWWCCSAIKYTFIFGSWGRSRAHTVQEQSLIVQQDSGNKTAAVHLIYSPFLYFFFNRNCWDVFQIVRLYEEGVARRLLIYTSSCHSLGFFFGKFLRITHYRHNFFTKSKNWNMWIEKN